MKSAIGKTVAMGLCLGFMSLANPGLANPGKGNGHGQASGKHHNAASQQHKGCPPGLAKKTPSCVPPGQAARYGTRVGDRLRSQDYVLVRDYDRYDIERRDDWRYYRDGDRLIRVDARTQQILSIINLARVLLN